MTLRFQTTLWILFAGLLLTLFSGSLLYMEGRTRIRRELEQSLRHEADRAATQLQSTLEAYTVALETWGDLPLLQTQILSGDPDLLLVDFLQRVAPAYPLFHRLRILDAHGTVLASTHLKEIDRTVPFSVPTGVHGDTLRIRVAVRTPPPNARLLGWIEGEWLAGDLKRWVFGREQPHRIVFGVPDSPLPSGVLRRTLRLHTDPPLPPLTLEMFPENARFSRELRRWIDRLVGAELTFLVLLLWLITAGMERILLRPLDRIRSFLDHLRAGDYSRRLPVHGPRELAQLQADLNRMAHALEERERARTLLGKYVHPRLVKTLLEQPDALRRERRVITVLFVDIQGFTPFAESHPLDEVVQTLQLALSRFTEAVTREQGMVDKFLGDGLLALFNAPIPDPDHPRRAVRSALHILQDPVLQELPFRFGIGIHTGEALVGRLGSRDKEEYTALGHTVNLASRLEHATRDRDLDLLVSDTTYRHASDLLPGARKVVVHLRGIEAPVVAWGVRREDLHVDFANRD